MGLEIETNIESDTILVEEDDICFDINDKIKEFKHIKQSIFCKENNYFNFSIMYFNNFTEVNINKLNKLMNNIKNKIEENYLDGKFLYEYLENNTNYEKEDIILENFDVYLENIYEIITFISSLNDEDYKVFLNNSLIKSFMSYENVVNNYIINEMIDNITILINNKIEFYLDYIQEKLINEYLYYVFLLNRTKELGNSTHLSLLNLFTDIINKIEKSINNSVKDEISFYIDIFYRQNKKIFTNNYINYFIQEKNEYNIDIYKLKDYISELIYDKNFNKSLNNYSYLFVEKITNEIKINIQQYIDNKIQLLHTTLNNIFFNLENILSIKEIIDINEDMFPIYYLIQDFSTSIKNQDNNFIFKVGEAPFELINIFIDKELRPPLILIKEKYNFIEEKILVVISTIADNFPDCYSLVRDNFINNRIEDVYNYITEINETIMEYKDILNIDIESYINKLSFYTLIDGLKVFENPCNNSDCMINNPRKNIIRKLESIKNDKTNYTYHSHNYHKPKNKRFSKNMNGKSLKKNKNIFFKRKLYEYDSSDPGLSKDDIIPYIEEIINIILDFHKIYLAEDYKHIKTVLSKYLIKINGTCLNNLKRSFSIKLQKFSTLITEEKMEFLKNKIMAQYYQIEPFIHERSGFIQELINNFTIIVNNTIKINQLMSEHISQKIDLYYDLLTDNIQSKYKIIEIQDLNIDSTDNHIIREWDFITDVKELEGQLNKVDKYLFDLEDKAVSYAKDLFGMDDKNDGEESTIDKFKKAYDFMKSLLDFFDRDFFDYEYTIIIPLPVFPCLNLVITNYVKLGSRLEITPILDDTIGLSIDLSVRGEIGTSFDIGIYFPDPSSPVFISVSAGMKGILASGRVGIRLNLFLVAEKYETDLYFIFNAFGFQFYVKFCINIRIWRIKYSYTYYLINYKYFLYTYEKHKKKLHDMKFFNLRTKMLLQDRIKNALN